MAPDDHAVAESPTLEMMVTVAAGPSKEVAGASPHVALGTSSQRLDDDVVRKFDATHRLSELTTDWGILVAGAASFGE
jgi:hypothetical protein